VGTLQGDALSMIFFNVACHIILTKIKIIIPEVTSISYCDDLTVLGKKGNIKEQVAIIWPIIESFGFRINKSKCKFISNTEDTIVLGMPIGSQEFVDKCINNLLEELHIKTARINTKNIEPKTRLLFLKECINTVPTYMIRLLPFTQHQFDAIDNIIDNGISQVIGRSITNGYSELIRGLSQDLGGLGIHRYGTGFGQILHDILRVRTNTFIAEFHLQDIIPTCHRLNIELSLDHLGLKTENDPSLSSVRHGRILKNIILPRIMDTFYADKFLVANAALLLSASFKGSAYHLTNYNGFNFRNDSHYTHALSNILLLPICDNHETMDCFCIGNQLDGKLGYKASCSANLHHKCLFPLSHLLSCSSNSGYKIGIHNICVKAIKSYIQAFNKDAIIELEPRKTQLFEASQNTREDLKITFKSNNDLKLSVDFTICNPAQHTGIAMTLNCVIEREQNKSSKLISDIKKIDSSCSSQLYLNKMVEVDKAKHHSNNLEKGFSFYPFVVDTSGNWGNMAKNFIKFINKLSGVKETIDSKGHPRTCRQEIYLFKRIQFFCNLRGAIARENALLQLKPMKFTGNLEYF
jgi:hypothetical protein